MKYLVKFCENYAGEFDVHGMMLLTKSECEEFYAYWERMADVLDAGYQFKWYFGSNEFIYFSQSPKWREAFTFEAMSEQEAEVLEDYIFIEENYFGLLPEMEFMYNELECYDSGKDDEDD